MMVSRWRSWLLLCWHILNHLQCKEDPKPVIRCKVSIHQNRTLSVILILKGRQPHCSQIVLMYCLVVQLSNNSLFWQNLVVWSSPRKYDVTSISFRTFKLYSPSPGSSTGSTKTYLQVKKMRENNLNTDQLCPNILKNVDEHQSV